MKADRNRPILAPLTGIGCPNLTWVASISCLFCLAWAELFPPRSRFTPESEPAVRYGRPFCTTGHLTARTSVPLRSRRHNLRSTGKLPRASRAEAMLVPNASRRWLPGLRAGRSSTARRSQGRRGPREGRACLPAVVRHSRLHLARKEAPVVGQTHKWTLSSLSCFPGTGRSFMCARRPSNQFRPVMDWLGKDGSGPFASEMLGYRSRRLVGTKTQYAIQVPPPSA